MIDKFLTYLDLEKSYSKHTLKAYQNDIQSFKDFLENNFAIENFIEVSYHEIRTWIIQLSDSGLSNKSINRKISSLRSFYKFLEKIEFVQNNPLQQHKSLKVPKKLVLPFSKHEMQKLKDQFDTLEDFDSLRDFLLIEMLYTTGMRRAELINLKWTDISFSNQNIRVLGKRNKERLIPLLSATAALLKKYRIYWEEIADDTSFVFITAKGKQIYESLVYIIVRNYISQVTTKSKKSPHVLRHSFATHLLDEGADLNAVKDLLGHASLASTQIYTQTSLEYLKKVYKKSHPRNNFNKK